jgi:hypothetical protein
MTVMGVMGMAVVRELSALSAVALMRVMRDAVLTHVFCVQLVRSTVLVARARLMKVLLLAARMAVVSKLRPFCHPATLGKELFCISVSTITTGPTYAVE